MLKLYLLGRFEVVRAGAPVPAQAWRRRRPADLLKLVALAPGRTLSRDAAIDALWPDKDPASGANNLHRALYDLRQILGARWVDIAHGQLTLRRDAWVDVDVFEDAVLAGGTERWALAVSLYRGDLAPDDRDVPWIATRRAVLRSRFVEAALPLAGAAAEAGDGATAIPLLRRVLDAEPACEEHHRLLMRLLAESGRRAEALRQYDACETLVRASGRAPGEDTVALRAAIQRGEVGASHARPPLEGARRAERRLLGSAELAPVRGRGAILLLFESLLEAGSGALVLLGERGVGKTRLALEGARLAQARGAAVVAGVAGPHLGGAPYGLFADAIAEEVRVNPAVSDPLAPETLRAGVAGEEVRRRVFEGVERTLRAIAGGRRLYLVLDELQDADESSLNLLHYLARRARELSLMVVATCSEEAIHAGTPIQMGLAHLDAARLARGVRIPRLGLDGTRAQVADLLGAPVPDAVVAHVHRVTDGSPALVEEVVRAWAESGRALVPSDPAAAIRGRVARLGPRAEALLGAACVAGQRFEFETVRAVSGLTAHEALEALQACLDAHLVDESGGGYHFHHALVRRAIHAGLLPERRADLHARIADAIDASAAPQEPAPEVLAYHRRRAGQRDRALRHLVAAGHRAAARAGHREALGFYEEALQLVGPAGEAASARLELLDAAGRAQLALGEIGGAARAFSEAARLEGADGFRPAPDDRARAFRLAAVALASGGHLRAALAEVDQGLQAGSESRGDEVPALLHLRSQLLLHDARFTDARCAAEACAARAAESGDADLLARGDDVAALAHAMTGERLAPPARSVSRDDRAGQDTAPEHPIDLHLVLWDRDLAAGVPVATVARLASLLGERARQRDAPDALAVSRTGEGSAAIVSGQPDVAEAALRDALDGHRASGFALGEALTLERLAVVSAMRGRMDQALELVEDGIVVAERATLRRHALVRLHATEARIRLATGATYAAEDAIREASETAARHGECLACDAAFRPEALRVALARGRIADAEAELLALEEIARRRGGPVLEGIARLARARVLASRGLREDAATSAAAARVSFLAAGHRYHAGRSARFEARLRGHGWTPPAELEELTALVAIAADV